MQWEVIRGGRLFAVVLDKALGRAHNLLNVMNVCIV